MDDPYRLLGVPQAADAEAIRDAFRKLAKTLHPDLNPSDAGAEERFKRIIVAYEVLSDPRLRARFDRGEVDEYGTERRRARAHAHANAHSNARAQGHAHANAHAGAAAAAYSAARARARAAGARQAEAGDDESFANFFGNLRGNRNREFTARGADVSYRMSVDFVEAARGGRRRVTMADGRTLDVTIPPGLEDGQTLRLKGQGKAGFARGTPGDAHVDVQVLPHPLFQRQGNDVHIDLPVTVVEALLGGRVTAPTVHGPVTLSVPRGANNGMVLRLRGKGIAPAGAMSRGDQYVTLRVALPSRSDPEFEAFIRAWSGRHPYNPRQGLGGD
ncbi:MAG: J domain-containing protein [Alphaproteobacteria bacterium]|nr:J domain-containing protein [Alphaproteobacteria bacterium]